MSKKKKPFFVCVDPSLAITVWHHKADLVMPNCDPQDGYFKPTLTLILDLIIFIFYWFIAV